MYPLAHQPITYRLQTSPNLQTTTYEHQGVFLHTKIQLSKYIIEQEWRPPGRHEHIQHPTHTNNRTPTPSSNAAVREDNKKVLEQSITHPIQDLYKNSSKCSLSQYIWINLHHDCYGKWEYGRLISSRKLRKRQTKISPCSLHSPFIALSKIYIYSI